jgi:hypothetical protein
MISGPERRREIYLMVFSLDGRLAFCLEGDSRVHLLDAKLEVEATTPLQCHGDRIWSLTVISLLLVRLT